MKKVEKKVNLENKKIFITGGAGFIANRIISSLVEKNKIIVYDNFSRDTLTKSKYINHKNIKIIKGDVLDINLLTKSMKGSQVIIHAAAIAGIDTVIKNPVKTMQVNFIGTSNTLEAARLNNVKNNFIDFSTSEIFGNYAYKSNEDTNAISGVAGEARWTYAVSKLAAEHLVLAYYNKYKLPTTTVRPFNIYGPGQTGEGALINFIKKAINNEDIYIYGDGSQIRAWCFIDDFIDCILKILVNSKSKGQSFNIGNSKAIITVYGLAQTICRVLNSKSKIIFKPSLSADIELRIPSVEKSHKILGFKAKIGLSEGIIRTANWLINND